MAKRTLFFPFFIALLVLGLILSEAQASTVYLSSSHSLSLSINNASQGTFRTWEAQIWGDAARDPYLDSDVESYSAIQTINPSEGSSYSTTASVTHSGNLLSSMNAITTIGASPTFYQNLQGTGLVPAWNGFYWAIGYTREHSDNAIWLNFQGDGQTTFMLTDSYTYTYGFSNTGGNPLQGVGFRMDLQMYIDNIGPFVAGGWAGQNFLNINPGDGLLEGLVTESGTSILEFTYTFGQDGLQNGPGVLAIGLSSELVGQTAPPVPLPSTVLLLGSGLLGLVGLRRFRKG